MFKGIIPAMVTPITNDQQINGSVVSQLVNKLIGSGVDGLFALGTNGEFHLLARDEKIKLTRLIVEEANGRVPVIVGVGGNSTSGVIELSKIMEDIGVDALSVITPFFITPSQEEVIKHYLAIAESTSLPIILYNIPSKTGMNLEPETVGTLAKIPNIVGIKDSSGNFDNIRAYIESTKQEDFFVMCGTDSLIFKTLEAGGVGAITATANAVPKTVVSIYQNWLNGNLKAAQEAQEKLKPLRSSFQYGTIPSVLKKTVELTGIPVGPPKLPVTELSGSALEKVKEVVTFYAEWESD
ncbi:4-hydroxy-tetrahydrodipicolinate synthase [Gracilibacillus sp. S3-1-1]|uniref:4-hydroxy-tetrahydrodipicolinate synthase n=1 Tax=Gracilibacillus pellucidus TaxID=3095368 RepID=A0ACC6M3G6_9BACI|nr:4-hydroxy-tetrahydrodipicolinate synthase [Gracilibacillus sp. S3-1-1]MDX8045510.1 4-hydroxy-tetrahydrodipicolinate synthase [Gracilibacillus sp. S3-1-1]